MRELNLYSPLMSIPPPIPQPLPPLCDAIGGAFYYLGSEYDHLPEAGNKK